MIYCYNCHTEDHTSNENNFYIGRGSVLGNPFTFDGKKSSLARLSFKTREECLSAYEIYFDKMYETDLLFKTTVDNMYEKYKNGEDIYLQCFCKPLPCHGDLIKEKLEKRLIKEHFIKRKKNCI